MAGAEERIEVLEDELKLLKGEVKRTSVDLRAFVMREDSPLNERISLPPPTPDTQTVTQVTSNGGGGDSGRVEALEDELRAMRKDAKEAAAGASSASGDKAMDVLSQGLKSQQGDIALELLSEELKSQRKERSDVAAVPPTPAPVAPAAPTVEANVSATPAAQASPAPAAQPATPVAQPATPAAPAEAPIPQPEATSEQVVVQSEQNIAEHEIPVSQGPRGRRERSNGHQRPTARTTCRRALGYAESALSGQRGVHRRTPL